jgi:hypothetical protein
MTTRRHSLAVLVALLTVAFAGCDTIGPTAPADLSPLSNNGKGGGNNKDKDGTGGSGTVTVTLTESALGEHAGKNYRDSNRKIEISGGPQAATTFAFAGALARYEGGQCVARRGALDGPELDDEDTADALAAWLTRANVVAGFFMTYDNRPASDGQPSDGNELAFNFTDDAGRAVSLAIFAHGDPPPTIHRIGDTFTVSGGVVRVWLRDGPPKNHPKLFCRDHGDRVVLTVQR